MLNANLKLVPIIRIEAKLCKIIIMSLLNIIILLVVFGVILWLVNSYIPMDSKIKSILNVVVVIVVVVWLLQAFGFLDSLQNVTF